MAHQTQYDTKHDLGKPLGALLEDIYRLAYMSAGQQLLTENMLKVIAKFSCLLVKMSEEAAKQTRSVVVLTRALVGFTVALLLLAAIQTFLLFHGK